MFRCCFLHATIYCYKFQIWVYVKDSIQFQSILSSHYYTIIIGDRYKPTLAETGPFGFSKYSYKYDVHFDDNKASKTVRFKEYSILREQKDTTTCQVSFLHIHNRLVVYVCIYTYIFIRIIAGDVFSDGPWLPCR